MGETVGNNCLVLMEGVMLSTSLIQFSVDGQGCVPSLLLTWGQTMMDGTSLVAQTVKRLSTMRETWVRSLVWEDSLEKERQPTPVFLPGESHGGRSLVGYSPRGRKELATTELLHFHFQGKKEGTQLYPSTENWIKNLLNMALHIRTRLSIPLSQSIPWTLS